MANEKKIAKYQKLFLSWLEDAVTVEEQLENESDPKKVDKLQKNLKKIRIWYCIMERLLVRREALYRVFGNS